MGRATFQNTPTSPSTQDKPQCLGISSNVTLRMKSEHERTMTSQLHHPETAAGSKYNSTSGPSPHEQLERPAEFQPHHKTRPYSPVPTLQRPCDRSQKWRGTLRFPSHVEMRPYSSLQRCARTPEGALKMPKEICLPCGNTSSLPG